MSESHEHRESPRRVIEGSLQKLFDDLKEHLALLIPEDYEILSTRFSGEVKDYVGGLLEGIESGRAARIQRSKTG